MSETARTIRYFPVPVGKFVVLSLFSFGVYEFYWVYKSWAYVRARDGSRISPAIRAIFQPFTFPALMADMKRNLGAGPSRATSILLAVCYLALSVVSLFPDPYALPGLLTFVCLLPAVRLVQSVHGADSELPPHGWTLRNRAFVVLAAPVFAYTMASTIGLLPSSQIEPGWMLWGRSQHFLTASQVLAPGETVLYFYAGGLYSFAEDGNLLTDRRVIHYDTDSETGKLLVEAAEFDEIDFTKNERGNWWSPTALTVVRGDGTDFVLHLPASEDRDRAFIDRLERLRVESRREPGTAPKLEA